MVLRKYQVGKYLPNLSKVPKVPVCMGFGVFVHGWLHGQQRTLAPWGRGIPST